MNDPLEEHAGLIRSLGGREIEIGQVLEIVRRERIRRRRGQPLLATAAVLMVTLAAWRFVSFRTETVEAPRAEPKPVIVDSQPRPEAFAITRIDDEGLLELLKDQPVALVNLPNGEQRLMVIVNASPARPGGGRKR